MSNGVRMISDGIIYLLTAGFGICLSSLGKPYNAIIFTIHKVIAVISVVLIVLLFINLIQDTQTQALVMFLLIVAGISILALFATGALMSMGKMSYAISKTIHIIASITAVISSALSIYLLQLK
jgi:hypothetical protein